MILFCKSLCPSLTYQILYDSVDSEGNHAVQVTRTVNVVDSTIPVTPDETATDETTTEEPATEEEPIPDAKKSGSSNEHKTRPTFGISEQTLRHIVDCGYSMDGVCTDVTEYHVDYDRSVINTGTSHDFALKAYAHNGMKTFVMGFGVAEVGAPVSESEAVITVNIVRDYSLDFPYVIDYVEYDNDNNVIGENATFALSGVPCNVRDTIECAQLSVDGLLFREATYDEPFLIEAIDTKRRVTTHYMNEGLHVVGDSLNPAPVETLRKKTSSQEPHITISLVRTDKLADIWTDQFGYTWSKNTSGSWHYVNGPEIGITSACDDIRNRVCDVFAERIDWHTSNMELLRDSMYGNIYITEEFDDLHDAITILDMDGDSREQFLIDNNMMWIRD